MINFIARIVLNTLKLLFKVVAIFGGLIFWSFSNAARTLLDDGVGQGAEDDFQHRPPVYDDQSALQAAIRGDLKDWEHVYFDDIKK